MEKIKKDLTGRTIKESYNGYFLKDWNIREDLIYDFQIISENKQGEDYLYEARLILQENGRKHEALINFTYVLGTSDDWSRTIFERKEVNIEITDRYKNCYTTSFYNDNQRQRRYQLFTNHCNEDIVVGFTDWQGTQPSSVIVKSNETYRFQDAGSKIVFVEQLP